MNGMYRRGGYNPAPQGQGFYSPYMKKPYYAQGIRQFVQNMMMMMQMKQQQQQQTWQRGMREKEFELKERQAERVEPTKPPTIPARVQEAIIASGQGGVPQGKIDYELVGKTLNKWRAKPGKPLELGIAKPRKTWLDKLDKDIDGMIKEIQSNLLYGELSPHLVEQVENLRQAKTKIRGALAIGADQPLPEALWKELGGISERLKEVQKKGLYPPKPKPLMKGKLPRMKRSELPAGTEIKWNPKLNLRMAKVKDKWYWIIE